MPSYQQLLCHRYSFCLTANYRIEKHNSSGTDMTQKQSALLFYLRQQKTCHEDRPALVVHSLTIPPISFHQTENCHESSNKVLLNANRNTNERQSHNTNLIKRKNCKEKDKLGLYQYDRVQEIDMLLIIGFE